MGGTQGRILNSAPPLFLSRFWFYTSPLGVLWPWGVDLALSLSDLGSVCVEEVTFYLAIFWPLGCSKTGKHYYMGQPWASCTQQGALCLEHASSALSHASAQVLLAMRQGKSQFGPRGGAPRENIPTHPPTQVLFCTGWVHPPTHKAPFWVWVGLTTHPQRGTTHPQDSPGGNITPCAQGHCVIK